MHAVYLCIARHQSTPQVRWPQASRPPHCPSASATAAQSAASPSCHTLSCAPEPQRTPPVPPAQHACASNPACQPTHEPDLLKCSLRGLRAHVHPQPHRSNGACTQKQPGSNRKELCRFGFCRRDLRLHAWDIPLRSGQRLHQLVLPFVRVHLPASFCPHLELPACLQG
jgi:hypothetical protein